MLHTTGSESNSSADSSSEDHGSGSESESESESAVLKKAGVPFSLSSLSPQDGRAPLELVSDDCPFLHDPAS